MADEPRSIEIKLVCGEDLRAFNFFQKLSVFALVSICSDDPKKKVVKGQSQQQRTPTDRENDGFPEWNHEMRYVLDSESFSETDRLFLHVDLRHDGVIFGIGDRTIGEVRIPLGDLTDEASANGVLRFVRYQVKNSEGKPNGVLKLSYRFNSRPRRSEPELEPKTETETEPKTETESETPDPCKVRYPKVEEVSDLDLLADSNLSHYSPQFRVPPRHGSDFWLGPPQTPSFPYPYPYPYPHPHPQPHHLLPQASPGYGRHCW